MTQFLTILPDNSPILRETSVKVDAFDDELKQFAANLQFTMEKVHGAGIAAPQVGVLKRVIIIDGIGPMVNPELIVTSEDTMMLDEGCLSSPGLYARVKRYKSVAVMFFDLDGNERMIDLSGDIKTVAVQHEIDHLNGKLFTDYLSPMKLALAKKHQRKLLNRY